MTEFLKVSLLAATLVPATAFAYLDPGTGSMLLQVILGGVAALGVAIKLFWFKIVAFFGSKKKPADEDGPA